MTKIKCKCGQDILLDEEDLAKVLQYTWHCNKKAVFTRNEHTNLACVVINVPKDYLPDHIDRNPHNNQKVNLRVATDGQNRANTGRRSHNTSGYKGVTVDLYSRLTPYRAMLKKDGQVYNLGHFSNVKEAALAYNIKAREVLGEFAFQNDLGDSPTEPTLLVGKQTKTKQQEKQNG